MLHITFAVGFPLSVPVSMIGPGQLSAGGSISTGRFNTHKKNVLKISELRIQVTERYVFQFVSGNFEV